MVPRAHELKSYTNNTVSKFFRLSKVSLIFVPIQLLDGWILKSIGMSKISSLVQIYEGTVHKNPNLTMLLMKIVKFPGIRGIFWILQYLLPCIQQCTNSVQPLMIKSWFVSTFFELATLRIFLALQIGEKWINYNEQCCTINSFFWRYIRKKGVQGLRG